VLNLKDELFIIDQYDEVVDRISHNPLGGFEIVDMLPLRFSARLGLVKLFENFKGLL
jgi:hypothetical protein